uniref:G protein-coupled receptor 156 n=1 Tax=Molossus molossus TaxID=27622 RepID=A0A7J8HZ54_MOLMO|nr:G protein-coupled receptor 156 [Molossus molossus]
MTWSLKLTALNCVTVFLARSLIGDPFMISARQQLPLPSTAVRPLHYLLSSWVLFGLLSAVDFF